MNEALIMLLLASLAINVIAVWQLTGAAGRSAAQNLQISELGRVLKRQSSQLERLQEYASSTHFHHDTMERALRHHLHAAGLVYAPRLWRTYNTMVKTEWSFDRKGWPYHLPTLDDPEHRMADDRALRQHDCWLQHPAVQEYHHQPQQCIDDARVEAINRMIHDRVDAETDASIP